MRSNWTRIKIRDLIKTIISPPCPHRLTVFDRNNQRQLWASHFPRAPLKYSAVCCNICRWFHARRNILMPLQNTRLGSLLKHLVVLLLKGEADCFGSTDSSDGEEEKSHPIPVLPSLTFTKREDCSPSVTTRMNKWIRAAVGKCLNACLSS